MDCFSVLTKAFITPHCL